ncbi:MAG: choice-of-anchor J domain-containing protein [Candidatus Marinimicrobia bacterium]|nr:choice-of-anchor J domain-containing protein [Candidatus Neomarinimicrobiota bacterium]
MKRLFSTSLLLAFVMLMTTGAFADLKTNPNADCDVCLKTSIDGNLDVNWSVAPVDALSLRDEILAYHDGTFEGQIGCGGGCAFGVRFTADAPQILTGLTIYTQGDAAAVSAIVSIYLDPAGAAAGPPSLPAGPGDGTAAWESDMVDLSSPDGTTQQFDLVVGDLVIDGGDYYVVVWENDSGFMGIGNDLQFNYIDRNWVNTETGWETINDAVGGDAALVGNFGITATYIYQNIEGSYMTVGPTNVDFGVLQLDDSPFTQDVTISNLGNTDFDVTSIVVDGLDFSTALATPVTVTAGTSVVMDVTFAPTGEGAAAGTYTITSDADNTTEVVVTASAMVYDGFPEYMIWNPSASISGQAFLDGLEGLGYTAVLTTDLFMFGDPVDAEYSAIFVTLGMYGDNNYVLVEGSAEVTALVDYAMAGNPIYMEGGDTWAYNEQTSLHGFFGIDGTADGSGDLEATVGANLLAGMDYDYVGVNSFVDHLAPASLDAMVFHTNPADDEACGIGNLSPGANTIGNSFEFGGLVDGASTVNDLLIEYVNFLAMPYTDLWAPSISGVTQFNYTLDETGPYTIEALIIDNVGVDFAILFYNINGGAFTSVSMSDDGAGIFSADIPGQVIGSTIGYYLMAMDEEGNEGFSPEAAPSALYVFDVVSHLPPTFVEAISGLDGQVDLTWLAPGTEAPPLLDCADFAIDALPFTATGTNLGMGDDFPVQPSQGEDVAYQLNVSTSSTYTISLCNGTDYDSKLEVFMEDCVTSTGYYNDDACGLQSELTGVFLETGTYLIVIDGWSGSTGNYVLDVFEEAGRAVPEMVSYDLRFEVEKLRANNILITPGLLNTTPTHYYSTREFRELLNYGIYRNTSSPVLIEAGNQLEVVGLDPMAYTDSPVSNGISYFYRISAIYDDGESAAGEVEAIPVNHLPGIPTGLQGVVDDMTVTLDWDDNTDYDFDYYNVYRDDSLIDTSPVSNYVDVLTVGGIYEYAVTAVDAEDAESEMSDDVTMLVGNLPPMRLSAESGLDGTVELEWAEPGDLLPGLLDCADELIEELPFYATGTNTGMGDDFDVSGSDNEDYAYQLWMPEDGTVDITVCDAVTDYDTKLEIFNEDCFTTTGYYNDDAACEFSGVQSTIEGAFLPEGLYLIVVDGFSSSNGNFGITVTESGARSEYVAADPAAELAKLAANGIELEAWEMSSAPQRTVSLREQLGYLVYRDAEAVSETLDVAILGYNDQYIPNGVEYCYIVEAIYDDGNSASNQACATPVNWLPAAPQNLTFTIDDHDITLAWDANTDYDLESYNIYRDDELILNTDAITFSENLPISNIYYYYVTAVDADGGESAGSNTAILPVGNLPPAMANAESGLDGAVNLTWMAPGTVGGDGLYEDFESGIFPPAEWSMLQSNANATWMLYDDILGDPAFEGVFSSGVWWDMGHQDEWLISPEFMAGATDVLTFWSYAQQASEHGDHYNVNISTDGGMSWDVLLDMSALPPFDNPENPGWNDWQVPYVVDLSGYAGQNVQLAWQAVDGDGQGLWYIWLLDAITVGPEGGAATFVANTGSWGTYPENASRENADQLYSVGDYPEFEPVLINSPAREMRSELQGYTIYRSETSPVVADATTFLVDADTLTFDYFDFVPLINGTSYYYLISANYPDETSYSPELVGTPMNHAPAAPVGLTGTGDEDSNVLLDWDDNTEYDFATYNVYRDDVFVINVAISEFSELLAAPGVYEYMITAIDNEDAESDPSEPLMVPTGPLPPERLHAESGLDGQVYLTWAAPGDIASIVTIEIFSDNYPGETSWDLFNEDGELIADDGGMISSPATLFSWELELSPSVYTWTIYDAFGDGICCAYGEGYYNLIVNGMTIATGGDFGTDESWTFDSGGIVLARTMSHFVGTPIGDKGGVPLNYAQLAQITEELEVPIYENNNTADRSFDGFQVYRDDVAVSDVLTTDTYSYMDGWNVDEDLDNGTQYCYTVAAVYTAATTYSNEDCATPLNHAPSVPQNVTATVDDATNELSVDWDDAPDYDLSGYNVYINDEFHTFVDTSQMVEIMVDGTYHIRIKTVDEGNLESDPSARLLVIVGEAPPENLTADGNFDDHIELNWREPGGGGSAAEFRYDDDVITAQLGFGANENAILGASHPVNAVLNSVSWYLTSNEVHTEAKIFIFGLDGAGVPDVNQPLHESAMLPNVDDSWNDYELPEPVVAENGFFIGVSTPGVFTAIGTDDGVGAPWEFVPGTQWGTADYTVGNDWLDVGPAGFPLNFSIRGYGEMFETVAVDYQVSEHRQSKEDYLELTIIPCEPRNIARIEETSSTRDITGYNVYRDGDLVGTTDGTTFDDPVVEDEPYMYEITATYSNGEDSGPSNLVEARANMAPGPVTSFNTQMSGFWSVSFEWEDPSQNMDGSDCYDLEGIMIKRNNVEIAIVDADEWYFADNGIPAGENIYEFIPFDEVPNYGAAVIAVAWGGPPPTAFDFESGVLPPAWNQSNPTVPWMVGTAADLSSGFWAIPDNGSLIAALNDDAAGSGVDGNNMLFTEALDFGNSNNVQLVFDSFYNGAYSSIATVEYRVGANGAWQVLELVGAADVWVEVSIDLSLLAGLDEVYIGFHHDDAGTWASGWAIDNIMFEGLSGLLVGDLNGDGTLDILDITRMIEIVTMTGAEVTPDELAVLDINGDGAYNVLDVVILIEAVLAQPTLAKDTHPIKDVTVVVEPMTLANNREWQNIPVTVTYEGLIAGFQADLVFDPAVVELGVPVLAEGNDNVAVYTSLSENTMRVLAIDLTGGQIDLSSGLLMNVPVQVIDENATGATDFAVEGLVLSGPGGVEIECECLVSIIDIGLPAPTEFSLMQNYPNPFNPTTNIRYDIAEAGVARLVIYNMLGQQVRTLVSGRQDVGRYEVLWNGLNDAGQPVATGIYIYHLQAGDYSKTHKMAFIK